MKLLDYVEANYSSRVDAALALGVSYYQLNNAICRDAKVVQLISGDWMLINKFNKVFK